MEKGEKFEGAIPQGSPASPVLFSIIISAIIDLSLNPLDDYTTGYVDDLNDIAVSRDITKATTILERTFQRKMRAATRMGLSFDLGKSELMHVSMRKRKTTSDMTLTVDNRTITIKAKPMIRLLGVTLDETLSFIFHAQQAASRGAQSLGDSSISKERNERN
jgi:hypothetical protein